MRPDEVPAELVELFDQILDRIGWLRGDPPSIEVGLAVVLPAHKALVLHEFADLIDRGPDVPLRPGIFSTLAREKADDAARGEVT